MELLKLILICLLTTKTKVKSHCTETGCTGPYRLETQKVQQAPVSNERYTAVVTVAPTSTTATIGYRSRYTAYCYDGGKIDPNTGCIKEHHFYPPDFSELHKWEEEKKCYYGHECTVGGDCWGSTAAKCQDDHLSLNTAKAKEYSGNNEEWLVFPHHSCISTWRCGVHSTELPIYLKEGRDGIPYQTTFTRGGEEMDPFGVWSKLDFETSIMFYSPAKEYQITCSVQCYQTGKELATCQFPQDTQLDMIRGDIFEVNENWTATYQNIHVKVLSNQSHPLDKGRHGILGTSKLHKKSKLAAAASLEDLTQVMTSMIHEASETNYNLFQLFQALTSIQEKLLATIESVAKLDDELVGRVLGLQSKTKWFNNQIFHLCPCFQLLPSNLSNCAGNFIYQNGRYTPTEDQSRCASFSENSVTTINMTSAANLHFSVLHFPPPQGTTASWEGWSWLAEQKQHLIDSMMFHDSITTPGSGNPLSSIYNEGLNLFSFWNWWGRVGPIASLVNLVLTVYLFMKR